MKKLLITGATGLLGGALLHQSRKKFDVTACVHRHSLSENGFHVVRLNVTDAQRTELQIAELSPDWIIHTAALTDVDLCEREPQLAQSMNETAARNIARIAKKIKARLLLVSTDSVFDGDRGNYAESDAPSPVNRYAASKWAGEKAALEELPDALVVRTNLYGWNLQAKKSLAEWALFQLQGGQQISGWKDVFFTPLFALDLADLLLKAIEVDLKGVFHLGSADKCSKFDFLRAVAEAWGFPGAVEPALLQDANLKAPRPKDTSLRCEKWIAATGIKLPSVRDGLGRMRGSEKTWAEFKNSLV